MFYRLNRSYLDLLNIVNDEHVLQVLHGSLHPVVERRRSLGVLQVELIYRLQLLLCPLLARQPRQPRGLLQQIKIKSQMFPLSVLYIYIILYRTCQELWIKLTKIWEESTKLCYDRLKAAPSYWDIISVSESYLQWLFAAQGEGSQDVPLIADLLTASVDAGRVVVVQFTGKHRADAPRPS